MDSRATRWSSRGWVRRRVARTEVSRLIVHLCTQSGDLARRDSNSTLPDDSPSDAYDPNSASWLTDPELELDEYEPECNEDEDSPSSPPSSLVKRATARQRIEMYGLPAAASGSKWTYRWRSHTASSINTSKKFFHLFQLLRRDGPGGRSLTFVGWLIGGLPSE
jgi:hypothetical protein